MLVAALVDSGPDGEWAALVLADRELAAPHLMLVEADDILRRAALAGGITSDAASLAHGDLLDLRSDPWPYAPLAERLRHAGPAPIPVIGRTLRLRGDNRRAVTMSNSSRLRRGVVGRSAGRRHRPSTSTAVVVVSDVAALETGPARMRAQSLWSASTASVTLG